jgi:thiamine-monophosphate kinase
MGVGKKKGKRMKSKTLGSVGEFGFIRDLKHRLGSRDPYVILGAGDDAAILRPTPGRETVFTTDMMVEGRHFDLRYASPWQLGAKAMAVNLSDCAAMGAEPKAAVVSLGAPKNHPYKDLMSFCNGLVSWGRQFGCAVVGGDTVGSDKLVVNVAMLGEIGKGKALRRDAARVGDVLLVTGTLGDSGGGLHSLTHPGKKAKEARPLLHQRHLTPLPRCTVGRFLVKAGLSKCAIDVSDGLSSEVNHLCEESGVGAEVHSDAIPLSQVLSYYCQETRLDPLKFAINGGEDYELLFTVPLRHLHAVLRRLSSETGVRVSPIGRIVQKSKGIHLIDAHGRKRPLEPAGFDHFLR